MGQLQIDIGERIAKKRKEKKLSQSDLAYELDKSLRTIQKYESGDIDMPISVLQSISEILGVSMNYLLGYDSSHIKVETLSDFFAFLFELDKKKEIGFKIKVDKAININERYGYIIFNGNDDDYLYNNSVVQKLRDFQNNRDSVDIYWMGYQQYDAWEEEILERYSENELTEKEREILDNEERMHRFLELDRKRVEEMRKQQEDDDSNDDDEQ